MDFEQPEALRVIIFGRTGVGKSRLCNKLSQAKDQLFKESSDVTSETSDPQTEKRVRKNPSTGQNCLLEIIDTPGFGDNRIARNGKPMTTYVIQSILQMIKDLEGGFNIAALCINANKPRVDDDELQDLEKLGRIFGKKVFKSVIVILTQTNRISESTRADEINKYKNELPELLKDRSITVDDILDGGDDNWDAFEAQLFDKLMQLERFETEILEKGIMEKEDGLQKLSNNHAFRQFAEGEHNRAIQGIKNEIQEELLLGGDPDKIKSLINDQQELEENKGVFSSIGKFFKWIAGNVKSLWKKVF